MCAECEWVIVQHWTPLDLLPGVSEPNFLCSYHFQRDKNRRLVQLILNWHVQLPQQQSLWHCWPLLMSINLPRLFCASKLHHQHCTLLLMMPCFSKKSHWQLHTHYINNVTSYTAEVDGGRNISINIFLKRNLAHVGMVQCMNVLDDKVHKQ